MDAITDLIKRFLLWIVAPFVALWVLIKVGLISLFFSAIGKVILLVLGAILLPVLMPILMVVGPIVLVIVVVAVIWLYFKNKFGW